LCATRHVLFQFLLDPAYYSLIWVYLNSYNIQFDYATFQTFGVGAILNV